MLGIAFLFLTSMLFAFLILRPTDLQARAANDLNEYRLDDNRRALSQIVFGWSPSRSRQYIEDRYVRTRILREYSLGETDDARIKYVVDDALKQVARSRELGSTNQLMEEIRQP